MVSIRSGHVARWEETTNLESEGDLLELTPHGVELLDVPPRSHEILGLDLAGAHLSVLGARLDLLDEGLLLLLELHACLVEFANGLVEHALVLAQTLSGRHALAEGPFEDLAGGSGG